MMNNEQTTKDSRLAAFGEVFRAATRPAVTVIFAAVIAQVVVERIDAPDWFIALAITVIGWWFADRTREHIKERKDGK